jgi:hypothetical protein
MSAIGAFGKNPGGAIVGKADLLGNVSKLEGWEFYPAVDDA